MLTQEQSQQIKAQLIEQIEKTFPEDKKDSVIEQIEEMNEEQLEKFLIQNKMISGVEEKTLEGQKCIFCSIVKGEIPSYKIYEDEKAIIVLELNPISKAHSILIPKEHISSADKLPKEILDLAEQTSKKIKAKLKPKDIKTFNSNILGHEIINILPIYKDETPTSEKKPAQKKELEELRKKLEKVFQEKPKNSSSKQRKKPAKENKEKVKEEETKEKTSKKAEEPRIWLPNRIP